MSARINVTVETRLSALVKSRCMASPQGFVKSLPPFAKATARPTEGNKANEVRAKTKTLFSLLSSVQSHWRVKARRRQSLFNPQPEIFMSVSQKFYRQMTQMFTDLIRLAHMNRKGEICVNLRNLWTHGFEVPGTITVLIRSMEFSMASSAALIWPASRSTERSVPGGKRSFPL